MEIDFSSSNIFPLQGPAEPGRSLKPAFSQHAISVYTVLTILAAMRKDLGLEAMSEFLDNYTAAVEKMNPELKVAVSEAMSEHAVYSLYRAVRAYEKD